MIVLERLSVLFGELLRDDPRRVMLGEDIQDGTSLGLSRGVRDDESLRARLLGTPLLPQTLLAHAGGLALAGTLPIVILPGLDALLQGLAGLDESANHPWRSGDRRTVPMVVVVPCGPGFGTGGDSARAAEDHLLGLEGVRVLTVGEADDVVGIVRHAITRATFDGPTVVLLPRNVLLADIHEDRESSPTTGYRVHKEGTSFTVFTWGSAVEPTLSALAHDPGDATVVEIHALAPLPSAELLAFAQQNGRVMITYAGTSRGGLAAELAAMIADRAILQLDAPVLRLGGQAVARQGNHEHLALPSVADIVAAAQQLATY